MEGYRHRGVYTVSSAQGVLSHRATTSECGEVAFQHIDSDWNISTGNFSTTDQVINSPIKTACSIPATEIPKKVLEFMWFRYVMRSNKCCGWIFKIQIQYVSNSARLYESSWEDDIYTEISRWTL